jgi:inner membrane protein
VEPVTHALASLALAQAAQKHLPRHGRWMVVIAGVAADLDFASYVGGAHTFMKFHRTALHSLFGSAVLCFSIAAIFWFLDHRRITAAAPGSAPLRFLPALAACALGAAGHLLLDMPSGIGVQLFWPFHKSWFAGDLTDNLDPWILVILLAGLLLPQLFRLVSEEIGERKKKIRGRAGAIAAILALVAYFGVRSYFHGEAENLLLARELHGREALSGGAFPFSSTPFQWRGIAITESTIEEVDIPVAGGGEYDPDRSLTRYKPDDTPALEAAQSSKAAGEFLRYARFPIASATKIEDGYRIDLRDARFIGAGASLDDIILRFDLNSSARIAKQEFRFASDGSP